MLMRVCAKGKKRMKIKTGFLLHSMGEEHVVVPVDDRTKEFCGMIRLNKTGAFLWEQLQQETTKEALTEALLAMYEVTKEQAERSVDSFTEQLQKAGVVE